MRKGLATSILLHVIVLAWALISIHSMPPLRLPEPEPVEVALVSPDAIVRLKQGERSAKQLESAARPAEQSDLGKRETPKPKQVVQPAAQPEPATQEIAKAEPAPEKDPIAQKLEALPKEPEPVAGPTPEELQLEQQRKAEEEQKRIEDEKKRKADEERKRIAAEKKRKEELRKKQEAKRIADAKKREEEKKKKIDRLAEIERVLQNPALADRDPTKQAAPPATTQVPSVPTKYKGPIAGAREGRDNTLTTSQQALLGTMIKDAVKRCWNINSGAEGANKIIVKVEVVLTPDGRLAKPPRVVNSGPGPLFADTANSAVRAIVQCEPYDFPSELYKGGWEEAVWTFDPQRMF